MNEPQAAGMAKELMLAMAQSGLLKIAGATTSHDPAIVKKVASRDAEYLTTLYRDLVSGLQG